MEAFEDAHPDEDDRIGGASDRGGCPSATIRTSHGRLACLIGILVIIVLVLVIWRLF